MKGRKSWCHYTRSLLCTLNLQEEWTNDDVGCLVEWRFRVPTLLCDLDVQRWQDGVARKSKLCTYKLLKPAFYLEEYVFNMTNSRWRIAVTQFRSGTNDLQLEQGRWTKLARDARVCPHGCSAIEDEAHVLLHCPNYEVHRVFMFLHIRVLSISAVDLFRPDSDANKLNFLLGYEYGKTLEIWNVVGKFICKALKIRKELLKERDARAAKELKKQ